MTYQDFLSTLVSPINYFINWLSLVADSLIHNYIFITILGIVLFISLFWLVYDIIDRFLFSHINKYDDFNNRLFDSKINSYSILDSNISKVNNNLIPMSRNLKISNGYNYDYFNNVYLDSKDNTFYNFANNDEVVSFIHNNFVVDSKDHNYLINKNDNTRVKRYVKSYDSNDNFLDLYNNVIVDSKDNTFYSYRN